MRTNRNNYFDNVKGILIVLVVFSHFSVLRGPCYSFFQVFNMPAFLMIAGYFFYCSVEKSNNLIRTMIKRCTSLAIPIISFGFINTFCVIVFKGFSVGNIFDAFVRTNLWFLFEIIFCSIIVAFIVGNSKEPIIQIVLCVIAFMILLIIWQYIPLMRAGVAFYPYFVIGYFLCYFNKKFIICQKKGFIIFCIVNVLIFPCMLATSPECSVYSASIQGLIYGISGASFFFFLTKKSELLESRETVLGYLGKNSLQIYYVHMIFALIMDYTGVNLPNFSGNILGQFIFSIIITVLVTALSCLLVELIKKNKKLCLLIFGRIE